MQKVRSAQSLPLADLTDDLVLNPGMASPVTMAMDVGESPGAAIQSHSDVGYDVSNAYCRVAAELHQIQQARPLTTVLIASALPGEGKSVTAANLALALSEAYRKRVVLVDADLRRPTLHSLFGTSSSPGLNDGLAGNSPLRHSRLSDTLCLVPAGSPEPNPLERLSSSGLRTLLSDQARRADWVIIDAPPLAVCPDAGLLAALVDGVVLVVGAGRTPLASVESAVKALGRERIVGVVLNRSTSPAARFRYPARKV